MVGASFVSATATILRAKKGVTAVGNAQVDTAQSKFGGASAYFDGTDDNLVALGDFSQTGDFTIECWFRAGRVTGIQALITIGNEATDRAVLVLDGSTLKYDTYGGGGSPKITATGTISTNTWYHVAAVRSGGTITIYRDGTSVGTGSSSGTVGNATNAYFGTISNSGDDYQGHLDEIRYSNTARYTTTFTPSTTPFVNDANTLLLIHADGTDASTFFEDDNGVRAQKGIIAVGNAQLDTAQSKFGGASALFDGTSDYLTIPNAGFNFAGDFTIEFWARHAAINDQQVYFDFRNDTRNHIIFYLTSGNKLEYFDDGVYTGTTNIAANTWYHIALSRSGSALRLFINGTQEWNNTNSRSHTNSGTVFIGISYDLTSSNSMNGHIDEFRVSNLARYTAGFTPSTTPFVNDANTLLLIHADGTDASTVFRDDNGESRAARGIQASGNAQIDTAQSKFGGAAALFDGSGDYLTFNSGAAGDFEFTAGEDFTMECWFRVNSFAQFTGMLSLGNVRGASSGEACLYVESSGSTPNGPGLRFILNYGTVGLFNTSATYVISSGVWYHAAIVRSGTTWKLYQNGVELATATATATAGVTAVGGRVGSFADTTLQWNGWVDEVRISDTARYTAGFTPSTTPFQNDVNTLLLIHADGTDASTAFIDDNGKRPI
jgi:hypothetical protein